MNGRTFSTSCAITPTYSLPVSWVPPKPLYLNRTARNFSISVKLAVKSKISRFTRTSEVATQEPPFGLKAPPAIVTEPAWLPNATSFMSPPPYNAHVFDVPLDFPYTPLQPEHVPPTPTIASLL